MQLEITATREGFRLEGELDMATAEELSEVLRTAATNDDPIVLDFEGVSFMDSSGLRALLEVGGPAEGTRAGRDPQPDRPGTPCAGHQHPRRDPRPGGPTPTRGRRGPSAPPGADSTTWSGV